MDFEERPAAAANVSNFSSRNADSRWLAGGQCFRRVLRRLLPHQPGRVPGLSADGTASEWAGDRAKRADPWLPQSVAVH